MSIRARFLFLSVIVLALSGAALQPAMSSPPSGKWAKEGSDKLLKIVFMEAIKQLLPGGKIAAKINSWGIDPLVTASTTEGEPKDKIDAWLFALGQAGIKTAWPPYGITLAGGKIFIGGSIYTTEHMLAAAHDQQIQAIITGKGTGGMLDRVDNVMAETPFMDLPLVQNRGITPDNLGQSVKSEEELRNLWFNSYGVQLRDLYGRNNAKTALDEGWPRLLEMWRAQRAEAGMKELVAKLDQAMQIAQDKVAQQEANGDGDNGGGDSGSGDGTPSADFAGSYANPNGTSTLTVSGSGASVTAHEEWATGGRNGSNDWNSCQASGNTLKCNWTGQYRGDPDKTGDRSGTLTVTLDGNHLTGMYYEDEPVFHWNVDPYPSAMHKGAEWPIDQVRQGAP